jgi:hypothetical protein
MNGRLPDEGVLLSRAAFREGVFARAGGRCVLCSASAVDAHHVLERKLYADGGFYLGNGAAVCERHHWECETTVLSVEQVRQAAGILRPVLPRGFHLGGRYDKWGNRCWPSGLRSWGPLQNDDGARRALAKGGFLSLLMPAGYAEPDEGVQS